MKPSISRFTQMDDWIFEVKMVRALRVKKYGEPYTALATLTANGESMYIDSQLTRENEDFSRKDFMTFVRFCESLEMKNIVYDKVKDGVRHPRIIEINRDAKPVPIVQLVKS